MSDVVYAPIFNTPFSDVKNARDFTPIGFNQVIFFGKGKIDDWGAWLSVPTADGTYCALPTDKYYFGIISDLGKIYGTDKIFMDLLRIYFRTTNKLDSVLIDDIVKMSFYYRENQPWALNAFMHVYYGFIAEEHKENAILGKAIKINGLYDLLINGKSVEYAADCYRNVKYDEILPVIERRHLYRF